MTTILAAPRPTNPSARPGAVTVERLGTVPYREAWDLQRERVAQRAAGAIPDTLLLLSHPPVVTLGKGGSIDHLVGSDADLERRGVEFVETDRGGDITFHGPGQIVGYTIVDLATRERDLHRFLRELEEVLIRALADFGLAAGRTPGLTGVWVGDAKVAAIGIRVSRWITHHGFALNVDTDLSFFDLIVPCGIGDRGVTSMTELLGRAVERERVEDALERSFGGIFGNAEAIP